LRFSADAIYRLAAKSAPPEVMSEVLAKAQVGRPAPDRMACEMISEAMAKRKQIPRREPQWPVKSLQERR
jgi:hypothetical protein